MLAYIMNPAKLSFSSKGEKDISKSKLLSLSLDSPKKPFKIQIKENYSRRNFCNMGNAAHRYWLK